MQNSFFPQHFRKCSTFFGKNHIQPFPARKKRLLLRHVSPKGKHQSGEVLEWLKRHAWKACKPLKGFESSNLFLSADYKAVTEKKCDCLFFVSYCVVFYAGLHEICLKCTPRCKPKKDMNASVNVVGYTDLYMDQGE